MVMLSQYSCIRSPLVLTFPSTTSSLPSSRRSLNLSKALNSESYNVPTHMAEGSTTMTIATDTTSLLGEYPNRQSTTGSRVDNVTTFNALRSGASVASSSGEAIYTFGLYDSSTGGNLQVAVLASSILHTSTFDIDVDWELTIGRA